MYPKLGGLYLEEELLQLHKTIADYSIDESSMLRFDGDTLQIQRLERAKREASTAPLEGTSRLNALFFNQCKAAEGGALPRPKILPSVFDSEDELIKNAVLYTDRYEQSHAYHKASQCNPFIVYAPTKKVVALLPGEYRTTTKELGSSCAHTFFTREMSQTIHALQPYGVTESSIRESWKPYSTVDLWDGFNKDALIYLITGQLPEYNLFHPHRNESPVSLLPIELRLQPRNALKEISQLNRFAIEALVHCYFLGLRGEHLQAWHDVDPNDKYFTFGHRVALIALIKKGQVAPEQAIKQITGITERAAWEIVMESRSTESTLGMSLL